MSATFSPRSRSEGGFSVAEVMIALGISAMVLAGISYGPLLLAKAQKENLANTFSLSSRNQLSLRLNEVLSNADIALNFQHLPLPTDRCTNPLSPCIRVLDPDTRVLSAVEEPSRLGLPPSIEFFRDVSGELSDQVPSNSPNPVVVSSRVSMNTPLGIRNLASNNYYAVWPLRLNSLPFVILSRPAGFGGLFLTMEGGIFSSSSDAHRFAFFKPSFPVESSALMNQTMVLYNDTVSSQYLIQKTTKIYDCNKTSRADDDLSERDHCIALAKQMSSLTTIAPEMIDNRLAIQFSPIMETSFTNKLAQLQALNLSPANNKFTWPGQGAENYLFPSKVFSMRSITNPPNADLAGPLNPHRVLHYYDTAQGGLPGNILAQPISIIRYSMKESAYTRNKTDLKAELLGGVSEQSQTILEDLPQDATLLFTRRLGTTTIQVTQTN